MAWFVVLDSGPLGSSSKSLSKPDAQVPVARLGRLAAGGATIVIPEIADYEVRRELLRVRNAAGVRRLDFLRRQFLYEPLTSAAMRLAAEYWASARHGGYPTADRHALDADVILAAQAILLAVPGDHVIVATTNVKHLARFVDARDWATMG